MVKEATRSLNKAIGKKLYAVEEVRSSMRHRPVGPGDAGLADAFLKKRLPRVSLDCAHVEQHATWQSRRDRARPSMGLWAARAW